MTTPLDDDVLGARLRAVLQDVSPLATDPLPAPRFAPAALTDATPSADAADVIELGTVKPSADRAGRRPRRRVAVAAGVLLAAAAVVATVVTTAGDVTPGPGDLAQTPAGPGSSNASRPGVVPPAGAVTAYPDVWRCTAPADRTITATLRSDPIHDDQIWAVPAGVTCQARPDEAGKYVFEARGISVPGESPAQVGGSSTCITGWSQIPNDDGAITSRGASDYLEFYGPGCYLVLPAR